MVTLYIMTAAEIGIFGPGQVGLPEPGIKCPGEKLRSAPGLISLSAMMMVAKQKNSMSTARLQVPIQLLTFMILTVLNRKTYTSVRVPTVAEHFSSMA